MSVRMFLISLSLAVTPTVTLAADDTKPAQATGATAEPTVKAAPAKENGSADTKSAACREPGPCGYCDCPDDGIGNEPTPPDAGNTGPAKPEPPKRTDP